MLTRAGRAVFFNYAPCLISQDVVGAAATAVGESFTLSCVLRAPAVTCFLQPCCHARTSPAPQGAMQPRLLRTRLPAPADTRARAPGVNIVPQIINIAVRGAQALPIGFNVNPAVILVNAQGAQAWPR